MSRSCGEFEERALCPECGAAVPLQSLAVHLSSTSCGHRRRRRMDGIINGLLGETDEVVKDPSSITVPYKSEP